MSNPAAHTYPGIAVPCTAAPPAPGVYAIRCVLDKRMYVGSSINVRKRMQNHRCALRAGKHHSVHLQRAWNKHGEPCFEFFVLGLYPREQLFAEEQRWFDETTCAFNGSRIAGRPEHTPEVVAKLQAAARTAWSDPAYRAKMAQRPAPPGRLGRTATPTTIATLRAVHRARCATIEAFGRMWSIKDLAETYGVKYTMLKDRLRAGWPPELAVSQPKRKGGL